MSAASCRIQVLWFMHRSRDTSEPMADSGVPGLSASRTEVLLASIVVPTYNRSRLLLGCLKSLEAQALDKAKYEVIVVDDSSADCTAELCNEFRQRTSMNLVYVRRQNRGGPAAARNIGITRATGNILAFIDDDCEAAADWLEQLCAPFREPHIVGVEGRVIRHPSSTPFTHFVENPHGGLFLTANIAYRRGTLDAVGGFDEMYHHAAAEDWDLAFRILEAGGTIAFAERAVVVHAPVPIKGRHFIDRVQERRSAVILYQRFPRRWELTTGRTMARSFFEGIFMGSIVEMRKWGLYFSSHRLEIPRFLLWQVLASGRLLIEYVRLRRAGLV